MYWCGLIKPLEVLARCVVCIICMRVEIGSAFDQHAVHVAKSLTTHAPRGSGSILGHVVSTCAGTERVMIVSWVTARARVRIRPRARVTLRFRVRVGVTVDLG